jgi:hypothetical protein
MKTVRCNMETFVKMMKVKHGLELEKRDVVNMSDVLDVIMFRYEMLAEGQDPEEVMAVKFAFTDVADEVARPVKAGEVIEEDEDEEETPKPRKKPAPRRKKASRG